MKKSQLEGGPGTDKGGCWGITETGSGEWEAESALLGTTLPGSPARFDLESGLGLQRKQSQDGENAHGLGEGIRFKADPWEKTRWGGSTRRPSFLGGGEPASSKSTHGAESGPGREKVTGASPKVHGAGRKGSPSNPTPGLPETESEYHAPCRVQGHPRVTPGTSWVGGAGGNGAQTDCNRDSEEHGPEEARCRNTEREGSGASGTRRKPRAEGLSPLSSSPGRLPALSPVVTVHQPESQRASRLLQRSLSQQDAWL